jgi:hypothetical protein
MIVIQIEVKQATPGNVEMQARGRNVDGVATADEVKAADKIMIGIDALLRSVGKYTEVRPLKIITKDVPPKGDVPPSAARS